MNTRVVMTWTGMVILTILSLLTGMVGLSALFVNDPSDPFPHDAKVLIATFALGTVVLALAAIFAGLRRRQWWAWLVLWVYPLFFLIHVLTLGTLVPDGIFAALAVIALLLARPRMSDGSVATDVAERRQGKTLQDTAG